MIPMQQHFLIIDYSYSLSLELRLFIGIVCSHSRSKGHWMSRLLSRLLPIPFLGLLFLFLLLFNFYLSITFIHSLIVSRISSRFLWRKSSRWNNLLNFPKFFSRTQLKIPHRICNTFRKCSLRRRRNNVSSGFIALFADTACNRLLRQQPLTPDSLLCFQLLFHFPCHLGFQGGFLIFAHLFLIYDN